MGRIIKSWEIDLARNAVSVLRNSVMDIKPVGGKEAVGRLAQLESEMRMASACVDVLRDDPHNVGASSVVRSYDLIEKHAHSTVDSLTRVVRHGGPYRS